MTRANRVLVPAVLTIGVVLLLSIPVGLSMAQCSGACRFEVQPQGGWVTRPANTSGLVDTFTVTNIGTFSEGGSLQCSAGGQLSCTGTNPTSFFLNPGQQIKVAVTYTTLAAGSGVLSLFAYYGSGYSWGMYDVTVKEPYLVAVTPDGVTTPVRPAFTNGLVDTFTVTNTGYYPDTYTLSCSGTGTITCTGTSVPNVTLGSGASTKVAAFFNTGSPGSGPLRLTANSPGHPADSGSYAVRVATVAITAVQHNGDYLDVSKCVANCFDATASYATPAYVSMDAARSITLLYRSSQAQPMGFVSVEVTDNTSPAPDTMSIRLQRPDLSWVTFTSGSQETFFLGGSGTSRLSAQFDAAGLSTGAYNYTAVARSWRDGSFAEATYPVRVLIVNETGSLFGAGWSIPGFQRLFVQSGGSAVITEGDGSIAFFQIGTCTSLCTFASPLGDFTTVRSIGVPPNITGYQRRYPDGTFITFNASGRLTSSKDRFNNQTSYAYDGSSRLSTITDPANKVITIGYGADGKLDWIRDAGNRSTFVTINGAGDLTEIVDPANVFALRPTYGVEHRMKQRLDRRGSPWAFAYDFAGRLAADTMPTITADGQSVRPVVRFTSLERAVLVDPASGLGTLANPAPRVIPANVRASAINPRGFETRYALDRFGAPTRIEEPFGRTTKLTRNAHSLVTADTSPSGHVIEYTWSQLAWFSPANLTKTFDRTTGRTVSFEYSVQYAEGEHVSKIYGDVDTLINTWFAGKLTSTRQANRSATTFTYDTRGRVLSKTDPSSHVTFYYYAASGWQSADSICPPSSNPLGNCIHFTFDAWGRRSSVKDLGDYVTTLEYDAINRNVRRIGPLFPRDTTQIDYDSLYVRSLTDPIGQRYEYSRNALGWVEVRTDPGLRQDRYSYDVNGNRKQWVNRRNLAVSYGYDALDRLASRTADGATTTYYFHPADSFLAATSGESTDTLRYDVAGRPEVEISVLNGTRYERKASYNVRDLRTALEIVAPWRDTISYRYNANMMLDTLIDFRGDRTTLVYDNDLLLTSVKLPPPWARKSLVPLPNHVYSEITYPDDWYVNSALGLTFDFDARGLVARRSQAIGDTSWVYFRDGLGRISRYRQEPFAFSDSVYTYDKVGNRTDLGGHTVAGNRLDTFNGDSLYYDADGNLVKRRRAGADMQRLHWNSIGQLVAAWTSGQDSVTLAYDGFGRRVRKNTVRYVWDGDDLLAEVDGSGDRLAEYAYYPGVDRPHSIRRGGPTGETYYFAQDVPGNVIGLLNTAGDVVSQYRYSTFGSDLPGFPTGGPTVENTLRFAARQLDPETGLYYVRARYYDPRLTRFISEDPIGLQGGINPYVYAGNNPVTFTDPSGEFLGALFGFVAIFVAEALGPASVWAALATAATVMGAAAVGSAVAAGIESLVTGQSFGDVFWRNYDIAGGLLGLAAASALLPGVQYVNAGATNILQGYVEVAGGPFGRGGFTLGAGVGFSTGRQGIAVAKTFGGNPVTLAAHEFGHTMQFLILSGLAARLPLGPWIPYAALGAPGVIFKGWAGNPWERFASSLGDLVW